MRQEGLPLDQQAVGAVVVLHVLLGCVKGVARSLDVVGQRLKWDAECSWKIYVANYQLKMDFY